MREKGKNMVNKIIFSVLLLFVFFSLSCRKSNPTDENPPIGDPAVYPIVDSYPTWSPDGTRIIYNHEGITRISVGGSYHTDSDSAGHWMMNADGTNPHLILKGNDINADWSPDSKWIVFEVGSQIYKAPIGGDSLDTAKIKQLTFGGRNFFPAWSPDGQWIAYNRSICEGPNICGIWMMTSSGTNHQFLAAYGNYPDWNPYGAKILFVVRAVIQQGQTIGDSLWTFNVSSNTKSFFTFIGGQNNDNRYPKYSPDGMKIVFESNTNIWVMNADGTNLKQFTTNGGLQPSWSPDGKKIVYIGFTNQKYDPQNNGTVWIMNIDGSNKQQLTYGPK